MKQPTIGLGILSWKAHETLIKSLQSYSSEFLNLFEKRVIYFSDISSEDKKIAADFGWDYAGGPNQGIAAGMKHLAENLETDYILLLQNDNPLVESADFAIRHIKRAVELMQDGYADLARMRHRWQVGEGFADVDKYLKYYDVTKVDPHVIPSEHPRAKLDQQPWKKFFRRLCKPANARRFQGRSVFIEENPDWIFPDYIQKIDDFYCIDSSAIDFTDQCLLISRDLWLNVFMPFVDEHPSSRTPNGFQAPETCINRKWWRQSHFKILQGQGVFTHARLDGSFRHEHHTKKNEKTA